MESGYIVKKVKINEKMNNKVTLLMKLTIFSASASLSRTNWILLVFYKNY